MIRRFRSGKLRQKRRKYNSESRAVCPRGFYLVRIGCADVARAALWWRSCGSMIALRWRSEGVRVALDYRSLAILGTGRRLLDLSPTDFFTSVCLGTARVFA